MSKCRRFNGAPVTRLVVSVPLAVVTEVARLLEHSLRHPCWCRAESVRAAIAEKLNRDSVQAASASVKRRH